MLNFMILNIIFCISLCFVDGQTNIPYRNTIELPQQTGKFEHSILNPNRFQMNHSFSLFTSISGNMNTTTGIYSNFSSYKLSERMTMNAGLHLIQGQNSIVYSSGSQMGISYDLGLEYKLSPNSLISLQVINFSNTLSLYRTFSPFNVP